LKRDVKNFSKYKDKNIYFYLYLFSFIFFHFYSTFDPIRGTPLLWHTMVNWKKAILLNSDVGGFSRIPSYS